MKLLQEMLELNEAGAKGLIDKVKSGYRRTQKNIRDIENTLKRDDEDNQKVNMQAVADDVNEFIAQYFTTFPNYDARFSPEEITRIYPSKEIRQVAAKAFSDLADRIEQLRVGFNRSMVSASLVSSTKIRAYDQQAKQAMGANGSAPPAPLIRFVRNESTFFKRLIKVKANLKLNDVDFKELLQLKMKQTNSTRKGDAAQALNLLFGHMISDFRKYTRVIEDAIDDDENEERRQRMADR